MTMRELLVADTRLELMEERPMSTRLRLPFDRRSGDDRRMEYDPDYFSWGRTERRSYEENPR
jgi:hypothetical protein